jgi:glyoxylase-like metal-dependent hydrolase (beta-lactamase superfamily II)
MSKVFTCGDVSIQRVIEQEGPLYDLFAFFPGLTPETLAENRAWMEQCGAIDKAGRLVLCIQSYVVRTPHHTVLIDSCVGNHKDRPQRPHYHQLSSTTYMDNLAAAGLTVDDIDFVMCTHLHVDHVGWNTRLVNGRWVPTFPNARYIFSRKEFDYWAGKTAAGEGGPMADSVLPVVEANRADLVASDFALDDHVRLTPTPGHTPDHVAVLLGKSGKDAVVCGDLIHSPLQARYPELSMRSDYDAKQGGDTRRSFLERYSDTNTLVCTGHFPSPSAGRISRWGNGFRFTPAAD